MNTQIVHNGKTYEIRSWVTKNGETIYRIMIDGNESGYFIAPDENGVFDLHYLRTITNVRDIKNPQSILTLAEVVSYIIYKNSINN